jgi:hypothetical protein
VGPNERQRHEEEQPRVERVEEDVREVMADGVRAPDRMVEGEREPRQGTHRFA